MLYAIANAYSHGLHIKEDRVINTYIYMCYIINVNKDTRVVLKMRWIAEREWESKQKRS